MKITLATVTFLVMSSMAATAAGLIVDCLVDVNFTRSDGTPLDASFTAKIGYSTYDIGAGSGYASLLAGWRSAGDISFATGAAIGYNGYFSGIVNFSNAAGLAGRNVFVWVTDGGSQNLLMENMSVQFPADNSIPNIGSLWIASDFLDDFRIILGSYNPNGVNLAGSGGSLVLVPEPSAALLGALGALGLLRRRRI